MKLKYILIAGTLFLALTLAGCQGKTLKASYFESGAENAVKDEGSDAPGNSETDCASQNPHPLAESISEEFEITYDEVMTLYCDGYAFSDILLALETAQITEWNPEDLLQSLETSSWEEIWDSLGVSPQ